MADKRKTLTRLSGENGSVQISAELIPMIAALAATEVEGVASMAGNLTNEIIRKVGMGKDDAGVKIETAEDRVTADLSINIEYGRNVFDVCRDVQEHVKNLIETMTGMQVSDVNVRVVNIDIPKQKKNDDQT